MSTTALADSRSTRETPVQTCARVAGILMLVSAVAGYFGELWVPSRLMVPGDAAATAANLLAHDGLFRLGFVAYLLEATCDVTLSLLFYILLRPVHRNIALLSAFFGLVSTAVFAVMELFYFAPTLVLRGSDYLKTLTPEQLNTLALLFMRLYVLGGAIFLAFYGIATLLRGYLIARSGYLPRLLGWLFALGGVGFIARNLVIVLAPAYDTPILLAPMALGGLALMAWLLVKGVDEAKWQARARP